jgi:hypothetical protein
MFATLTVVAMAMAGCGEEKSKDTLKEVIDVEGTCAEDHVGKQDHYAGQIVRWQSADTGEVNAYGFVTKPYSSRPVSAIRAMLPRAWRSAGKSPLW